MQKPLEHCEPNMETRRQPTFAPFPQKQVQGENVTAGGRSAIEQRISHVHSEVQQIDIVGTTAGWMLQIPPRRKMKHYD